MRVWQKWKMTNKLKRVGKGVFVSLLFVVHWTGVYSYEDLEQISENETTEILPVSTAQYGESCRSRLCDENLYCNQMFFCECRPGFRVQNNECVPKAGENETCMSHSDCCANLVCINFVCRRRSTNNEFVALAKICLGITVTSIIIALFSSSIKCLLRYDGSRSFPRQSNSSRLQVSLPESTYDIRDEKPPSYEECMRSASGNLLLSPPPYIISADSAPLPTPTTPIQTTNLPANTPSNPTIPLNVQDLNVDLNSNLAVPKDSETSQQSQRKTPPD